MIHPKKEKQQNSLAGILICTHQDYLIRMHLPNIDSAFIDLLKLREYCLNDDHPIGKYKARVFRSALQFEKKDAQKLLSAILKEIKHSEAKEGKHDSYGKRYVVDVNITNLKLNAVVRTVWLISKDENFPKLITCYINN